MTEYNQLVNKLISLFVVGGKVNLLGGNKWLVARWSYGGDFIDGEVTGYLSTDFF